MTEELLHDALAGRRRCAGSAGARIDLVVVVVHGVEIGLEKENMTVSKQCMCTDVLKIVLKLILNGYLTKYLDFNNTMGHERK